MKKVLKDPNILEKKPNLKLKPNHYLFVGKGRRWWPSNNGRGQAIRDGNGWYKECSQ